MGCGVAWVWCSFGMSLAPLFHIANHPQPSPEQRADRAGASPAHCLKGLAVAAHALCPRATPASSWEGRRWQELIPLKTDTRSSTFFFKLVLAICLLLLVVSLW